MRVGSADPRYSYIYQFIVAGRPIFAYHRQPDHDPCDHRHDYDPPAVTPATRTLPHVVREAQDYLTSGIFAEETRFPRPPGLTA